VRSAIWKLFAGGLLGKLLGVVRETLLAYLFGTSEVAAANRIAQTAALSPMNLVTTDALSGAFLPLEARLLRENRETAILLYRASQALFMVIGLLLVPALILGSGSWIHFIAPGSNDRVLGLAVSMLIIVALGVPSYLHYNMLAYLDMAEGGFRLSSVRATGQSIGLIAGTIFAYWLERPTLIAAGFSVAYILMSIWAMRYVRRAGYLPRASGRFDFRAMRNVLGRLLRRLVILIFLPIFAEAQILTEKMTISHLGYRTIAAVDYARLVTDTGILLLATPIGLASLPAFAILSEDHVRQRVLKVLEPFLLIGLGLAVIVSLFSRPIVEILYGRGAFNAQSVRITSQILQGMSLGLWAQLMNYFLVKVMNARSRNWVSIGVVGVATITMISLRPWLVDHFGDQGVGLAVSVGAIAAFVFGCIVLKVFQVVGLDIVLLIPFLLFAGAVSLNHRASSTSPSEIVLFISVCTAWVVNMVAIGKFRSALVPLLPSFRRDSSRTNAR
jgi:peptidoglycan biosynthesis protein MviN/MurJ (putative lipid II flippase)